MKSASPISRSTVIARTNAALEAEVGNEVVMMSAEKNLCYGLNPVGTRVWQLLAEPTEVGEICKRLLAEYDVDDTTCEREVIDLVNKLRSEGLIEVGAAAARPANET